MNSIGIAIYDAETEETFSKQIECKIGFDYIIEAVRKFERELIEDEIFHELDRLELEEILREDPDSITISKRGTPCSKPCNLAGTELCELCDPSS